MPNDNEKPVIDDSRRAFLEKAAKAATVAPAAVLLLSASTPAMSQVGSAGGSGQDGRGETPT